MTINNPEFDNAQIESPVDQLQPVQEESSRFMTGVRGAVIAAELLPVNEAIRFGAFGAAEATYGNPVVSAAVLGGATVAVEGAAAIAASHGIQENRLLNWFNTKLEKIGLSQDKKAPATVKAAAAYMGGSVVAMAVQNREDDDFHKEKARSYGLKTAAGLGGVLAVQGYMISKGIEQPSKETIGLALVGATGPFIGGQMLINKFKKRTGEKTDE